MEITLASHNSESGLGMTDQQIENATYALTIAGLKKVPKVGWILGAIVPIIFPPNKEPLWPEIYNEASALINQTLSKDTYARVSTALQGLDNVIKSYLSILALGNNETIKEKYIAATTVFEAQEPVFKSAGCEVLLLPLFAQMANLYLALLKDGMDFGATWGWNAAEVTAAKKLLQSKITEFDQYATKWYEAGLANVPQVTTGRNKKTVNWTNRNRYIREMTLMVRDQQYCWEYFMGNQPLSAVSASTRSIYSDPFGSLEDGGAEVDTTTRQLTALSIWCFKPEQGKAWIKGVQETYDGVLMPIRGVSGDVGETNQPPTGWNNGITSANPIKSVSGVSGDIINSIQFTFSDGTQSPVIGGKETPGGNPFNVAYDGSIVSQVHCTGASAFYNLAECVIIGFRSSGSFTNQTHWGYLNLHHLVQHPPLAVGDPVLLSYFGQNHHVYRDTDGNISDIWFDAPIGVAHYQCLNTQNGANGQPLNAIKASSDPIGIVYNNQMHSLYRDTNNNISDLGYDPSRGIWNYQCLNTLNGANGQPLNAPKAQGKPFGVSFFGQQHFLYRDANKCIADIWIRPEGWAYQNISGMQGANGRPLNPPAAAGDPFSLIYNSQMHVLYRDINNNISDLWYDPSRGIWNYQCLNTLNGANGQPLNAPAAQGMPFGVLYGAQPHILYRDMNNHIADIWMDGGNWYYQDITTLAGLAPLSDQDPVSVFYQGQMHVIYLDVNGHTSDVWYDGSWWNYQDLNNKVSSAPLSAGRCFPYAGTDRLHNLYTDKNGRLGSIWLYTAPSS